MGLILRGYYPKELCCFSSTIHNSIGTSLAVPAAGPRGLRTAGGRTREPAWGRYEKLPVVRFDATVLLHMPEDLFDNLTATDTVWFVAVRAADEGNHDVCFCIHVDDES